MSLLLVIALGAAAISDRRPIDEDRAIDLVAKAMHEANPRESMRCFSFMTEERSGSAFDIAVRENHQPGCGGDPGVMPVRDRFRVGRSPVRLWRLDPVEATYFRCRLYHGRPHCPRR